GMALLEVSQSIQLNTTSASWEEQAHIYMAARAGQVSSLLVELTATCSGSCTVPKSSAWGVESLTLFELESGELRFSGNPPANGQNLINPEWTLTVLAPGAVPIIPSVSWNLPDVLTIRCDRLVRSEERRVGKGCRSRGARKEGKKQHVSGDRRSRRSTVR